MDELRLLDLVLACTREGLVSWEQHSPDTYEGEAGGLRLRIEFLYPMLPGGTTSGADLVQVTCGTLCSTYAAGTEGMLAVRQTLRHAFPAWSDHLDSVDERAHRAAETLARLLEERQ
jgi:hypothetical protein